MIGIRFAIRFRASNRHYSRHAPVMFAVHVAPAAVNPSCRTFSLTFFRRPFLTDLAHMDRTRRQTTNKDRAREQRNATSGPTESTFERALWCIERSQQFRRPPPTRW